MPDIDILDINLPLSILLIFSLKVILQLFVLFAILLIYTLEVTLLLNTVKVDSDKVKPLLILIINVSTYVFH